MDFTFNINVTKKDILSQVSDEQIMSFYLKVPIKKGLFCSPLRVDNKPTCSFYRNKNRDLIFKDFATGQHLNIFAVVETMYNCNYNEALKIIANDFNIVPNSISKDRYIAPSLKIKSYSKIQVELKDFDESELKWWYKFGISEKILKHYNVYSCKHVFLNDSLLSVSKPECPIYGYFGGIDNGRELWKCYYPKRKEYRFLGNYPVTYIQGYKQLPDKGKICVITKSMKDVMCFYSLGVPACAPNSETVIPSKELIDDLTSRFENVFAIWDNDLTGVTFLNKIKRMYPQVKCLIIPRKYGAKDFSDLFKKYGREQVKQYIKQYLIWQRDRENQIHLQK